MECVICNHPKRKEIEQELLIRNFGDSDVTFKTIADTYNVPVGFFISVSCTVYTLSPALLVSFTVNIATAGLLPISQ